jgi:hypothetical protein
MTYAEWQAEFTRLSAEIAKLEPECKRLQASGDWVGAGAAQEKFYAVRTARTALEARKPEETGPQVSDKEPTFEEWLSEADWISHDLDATEIEWNVFRAAGDWTGAQEPQQKYHLLRSRQDAHNAKRPKE